MIANEQQFVARQPRTVCCIIGGLAGVPLGGISGINISTGSFPPGQLPKVSIDISPPPPPPSPTPPPESQFGSFNVSGTLGGLVGEIVGQFLNPFPTTPVTPVRGQPGGAPGNPPLRLQPSGGTVPELDFGFRPQPQVTGEVQTLDQTREFRPRQEVETLAQGGHGGNLRTLETTGQQTVTGRGQTLETIEQSRQEFESGHFQDPPGELDYVAPVANLPAASAASGSKPCATCSMLNPDPNATDSYPVEMVFHFKNHASAQRLGGLCEADGECEIA